MNIGIGITAGRGGGGSASWVPQTLVVEDVQPTKVVITSDKPNTNLIASDFTVSGFTVSLLDRDATNKILTLTLSNSVVYSEVVNVVLKSVTYPVTNNTTYINSVKAVFGNHLIAHWPLNETTGNTAYDVSGNSYNAAYNGASKALNQAGILGTSVVDFKGTAALNIYSAGLAGKFSSQEGFFSMCVAANNESAWTTAGSTLFKLGADGNNNIFFQNNVSSGGRINITYAAQGTYKNIAMDLMKGTRFFIMGVRWSKITDILTLFINGVKFSTNVSTLGSYLGSLADGYCAAFSRGSINGPFNGKGNNVFMLDYAPSDDEVLKLTNPTGIIVYEGDSRTDNRPWIVRASNGISTSSSFGFGKKGVFCAAVAGSTIADMDARSITTNAKMLSGKTNVLVVWCGVNSFALTAQQLFNALKLYCQNARASGWNKIIMCTEIDCQDASHGTWHSTTYTTLNTLIRNDSSFYDSLADLGGDVNLQDATNTTYFNADKVHLTDVGYGIVEGIVESAMTALNL